MTEPNSIAFTIIEKCPYPWCPGSNAVVENSITHQGPQTFVFCSCCGTRGPLKKYGDKNEAITAWNNLPRKGPTALEKTIEWHREHGQCAEYIDDDGYKVTTIFGGGSIHTDD